MVGTSSRRAVLGTAGAAITGAFAGCALNNPEVAGGHLFVENMLSEGTVSPSP